MIITVTRFIHRRMMTKVDISVVGIGVVVVVNIVVDVRIDEWIRSNIIPSNSSTIVDMMFKFSRFDIDHCHCNPFTDTDIRNRETKQIRNVAIERHLQETRGR